MNSISSTVAAALLSSLSITGEGPGDRLQKILHDNKVLANHSLGAFLVALNSLLIEKGIEPQNLEISGEGADYIDEFVHSYTRITLRIEVRKADEIWVERFNELAYEALTRLEAGAPNEIEIKYLDPRKKSFLIGVEGINLLLYTEISRKYLFVCDARWWDILPWIQRTGPAKYGSEPSLGDLPYTDRRDRLLRIHDPATIGPSGWPQMIAKLTTEGYTFQSPGKEEVLLETFLTKSTSPPLHVLTTMPLSSHSRPYFLFNCVLNGFTLFDELPFVDHDLPRSYKACLDRGASFEELNEALASLLFLSGKKLCFPFVILRKPNLENFLKIDETKFSDLRALFLSEAEFKAKLLCYLPPKEALALWNSCKAYVSAVEQKSIFLAIAKKTFEQRLTQYFEPVRSELHQLGISLSTLTFAPSILAAIPLSLSSEFRLKLARDYLNGVLASPQVRSDLIAAIEACPQEGESLELYQQVKKNYLDPFPASNQAGALKCANRWVLKAEAESIFFLVEAFDLWKQHSRLPGETELKKALLQAIAKATFEFQVTELFEPVREALKKQKISLSKLSFASAILSAVPLSKTSDQRLNLVHDLLSARPASQEICSFLIDEMGACENVLNACKLYKRYKITYLDPYSQSQACAFNLARRLLETLSPPPLDVLIPLLKDTGAAGKSLILAGANLSNDPRYLPLLLHQCEITSAVLLKMGSLLPDSLDTDVRKKLEQNLPHWMISFLPQLKSPELFALLKALERKNLHFKKEKKLILTFQAWLSSMMEESAELLYDLVHKMESIFLSPLPLAGCLTLLKKPSASLPLWLAQRVAGETGDPRISKALLAGKDWSSLILQLTYEPDETMIQEILASLNLLTKPEEVEALYRLVRPNLNEHYFFVISRRLCALRSPGLLASFEDYETFKPSLSVDKRKELEKNFFLLCPTFIQKVKEPTPLPIIEALFDKMTSQRFFSSPLLQHCFESTQVSLHHKALAYLEDHHLSADKLERLLFPSFRRLWGERLLERLIAYPPERQDWATELEHFIQWGYIAPWEDKPENENWRLRASCAYIRFLSYRLYQTENTTPYFEYYFKFFSLFSNPHFRLSSSSKTVRSRQTKSDSQESRMTLLYHQSFLQALMDMSLKGKSPEFIHFILKAVNTTLAKVIVDYRNHPDTLIKLVDHFVYWVAPIEGEVFQAHYKCAQAMKSHAADKAQLDRKFPLAYFCYHLYLSGNSLVPDNISQERIKGYHKAGFEMLKDLFQKDHPSYAHYGLICCKSLLLKIASSADPSLLLDFFDLILTQAKKEHPERSKNAALSFLTLLHGTIHELLTCLGSRNTKNSLLISPILVRKYLETLSALAFDQSLSSLLTRRMLKTLERSSFEGIFKEDFYNHLNSIQLLIPHFQVLEGKHDEEILDPVTQILVNLSNNNLTPSQKAAFSNVLNLWIGFVRSHNPSWAKKLETDYPAVKAAMAADYLILQNMAQIDS